MLRVFLKRRENFLYEVYVHLKKKSTGEGIKKKKKKEINCEKMALSCSHSIASEESFLNSVLYFSICKWQLLMRLFRITRFNTQQVLRRC